MTLELENFHCLGDTSVDDFLKNYWQKKPLLIRNAFPGIQSPLTADELAGLACEEKVNARLVLEKDGDYPWQAEFGPFEETRFGNLPETHWSLLVSDVERQVPETKSLVNPFRFLPDWRLDDLMISYAPEGGSVGPHIDDYDVFLIQLSGQRLWKISEHYSNETLTDVDLRILKNFTAEQEWSLSAGDMLYLPPNVAHHGIAQASKNEYGNEEHCMTASVGFRAPSLKTITSDYVHFLNENTHTATRYTDKSPVKPGHHAEISEETVSQFIEYLQQGLTLDPEHVKRWLGQYRSDNKVFEDILKDSLDQQGDIDFDELTTIAAQSTLLQSSYSNFLFSYHHQAALLFVDGFTYEVSKQFAELLCEDDQINFQPLQSIMTADDKEVFLTLFNNGSVIALEDS
jgi:50S ribosomal protein L16 3-hydroxylase